MKEQIKGVDQRPDPGFDFNPGEAAWKPDFSKYTPRASALLKQELGN